MGINLMFTIFMIMVALVFLSVSDRAESLDITTIKSGGVVQVNPPSIVILDNANGSEIQFEADTNTVYDNIQKLSDLKAGDKVEVKYQIVHNKSTALTITKLEIQSSPK